MNWLQYFSFFMSTPRIYGAISYRWNYLFIPLLVLAVELLLVGWRESSLRNLLKPRRTDWWDLLSLMLLIPNGRMVLGNFIFFGLLAVWVNYADGYFPVLHLGIPFWAEVLVALVFSDFLLYWAHRWKHENSWLWTTHEFHHSSTRLTLWTSFRVHPLDYFVSLPLTLLLPQMFFGWDVLDFIVVVIVNEASGYITHSRIDSDFGWVGKYILVSPRYHHLHHELAGHMKKNYGAALVIWDRLFGTYQAPVGSLKEMTAGLENNPYERALTLRAFFRPIGEFYRIMCHTVLTAVKRGME